jgi:Gpi18-like mannosyltransferase
MASSSFFRSCKAERRKLDIMFHPVASTHDVHPNEKFPTPDRILLASSIILQVVLALFFGHAYDMRIFMATGYLVGTGQNPYIAQNLSTVFHNSTFQGITSFGYPPPWSLVLGLIYLCTYKIIPNFLFYNLAIKLPIIAANICLAYLVVYILNKLGVQEKISRRAWIFLLFNPFLLCTSSAWGQFDIVVALLSLSSLLLLWEGRLTSPAILLALAICLKPIALPLILVIFVYLTGMSLRRTLQYFAVFTISMILFCMVPFILFKWNPSLILQHWNFYFTVGGGLSFMTFLEYTKWTYQLPGQWWFLGWLWIPALVFATYAMKSGIKGFEELLKKSVALILVFYLCRAWLSETNINLILPLVLILTSIKQLDRLSLAAVWVLPLIFSFFNTSIAQLFFPSMPGLMDMFLKLAVEFTTGRYDLRTITVVVWLVAGWWIVFRCFKGSEKKFIWR